MRGLDSPLSACTRCPYRRHALAKPSAVRSQAAALVCAFPEGQPSPWGISSAQSSEGAHLPRRTEARRATTADGDKDTTLSSVDSMVRA
eukprot:2288889-Prymnesium_polylepis.4